MPVSIAARMVRIPVIAAAVVVPMLAACSDPLSPTAQAPRVSSSVARSDSAQRSVSGGSVPWFDSQTSGKSGGSVPWFDKQTASASGGSVPWF